MATHLSLSKENGGARCGAVACTLRADSDLWDDVGNSHHYCRFHFEHVIVMRQRSKTSTL